MATEKLIIIKEKNTANAIKNESKEIRSEGT